MNLYVLNIHGTHRIIVHVGDANMYAYVYRYIGNYIYINVIRRKIYALRLDYDWN